MDGSRLAEPGKVATHESWWTHDDPRIGVAESHSGRRQVALAKSKCLIEITPRATTSVNAQGPTSETASEKPPSAARVSGPTYLRKPAKENKRRYTPEGLRCAQKTGLIEAASAFIESFNVTHYFTLTYARRISWEGRYKAFLALTDSIEWMQGCPLGWFRADEMRRYSGLGLPEIPEHHHGLLVNTGNLCCNTAEHLWRCFGDALVERYEPHGGAVPYCLKHTFGDCGDWDIGGKALRRLSYPRKPE